MPIPTNIHPVGRPTAAVPPSAGGLLQQIPPQSIPLGEARDAKGSTVGTVTIDINWYLFLYNLSKQTLSAPQAPISLSAADLLALLDDSVPPNPKSSSSVNQGSATIDFGTGALDAKIAVTGQGTIASGSRVQAWLSGLATTNNLADAGFAEDIAIFAGDIIAGTGFTVYAFCRSGRAFGQYVVNWSWA